MKTLRLAFALLICITTSLRAAEKQQDTTLVTLEVLPKFKGGEKAFGKYITTQLTYPEVAKIIGVNGRTLVSFVVDRTGKVVEVEPLTCVGAGCEAEAVRIIRNSPRWSPGMQDGKPVRVSYTIPIQFYVNKTSFKLAELRQSSHNYVILLDGQEYTLDDCAEKGFRKFQSSWVETSYLHPDQKKFAGTKPQTYVIQLKDEYKDRLLKK